MTVTIYDPGIIAAEIAAYELNLDAGMPMLWDSVAGDTRAWSDWLVHIANMRLDWWSLTRQDRPAPSCRVAPPAPAVLPSRGGRLDRHTFIAAVLMAVTIIALVIPR